MLALTTRKLACRASGVCTLWLFSGALRRTLVETEEADGSFGGGGVGERLTVSFGQHVLAVVLQQQSRVKEGGKTTTDTVTDRATD